MLPKTVRRNRRRPHFPKHRLAPVKVRAPCVCGGVARTFGPLLAVLAIVLLLPDAIFRYHAIAQPMTADSGQVVLGLTCVAFSLLLLFYLLRESQ
jgi:hypothetical protein